MNYKVKITKFAYKAFYKANRIKQHKPFTIANICSREMHLQGGVGVCDPVIMHVISVGWGRESEAFASKYS